MLQENHLVQLFNTDETVLFWRSLPRNTQAFKNEDNIPGKKISKDTFLALLGANASGTHRLQPVIVGKSDRPCALKDCMHELLVVYYNTHNSWFASPCFSDWFFKHFVPKVRHYRENVFRIALEKVRALHLYNAPANPDAEKLQTAEKCRR